MTTKLDDVIADALHRAASRTEFANLAGVDLEVDPYTEIITSLRAGIAAAETMRSHTHQWSENGFCHVCGADGNA